MTPVRAMLRRAAVLDDGGMPHAHALDVGDGVVFPAGESVDARDVSDSHDSVPCCQLKGPMDLRDVAGKLFGGSGFEQLDDPVVLGVVDPRRTPCPSPSGRTEQPEPVDAQELLEEGAGFQLKVRFYGRPD